MVGFTTFEGEPPLKPLSINADFAVLHSRAPTPSGPCSAMGRSATAIAYLDSTRLVRSLSAGIRHVSQRRDYLNKINVFPVPDGDTGTNLVFTLKTIQDAVFNWPHPRVDELMAQIADAALEGARGNSGAILAQYLQGFREHVAGKRVLRPEDLSEASAAGSRAAWKAMSKPVPGTLPTVLEAFSDALSQAVARGERDFRVLFFDGLERARESLANTPNLLPALRQAGVVDAGAQGFVDLLEGMWAYTEEGSVGEKQVDMPAPPAIRPSILESGAYRYCTECVIAGSNLDRDAVMKRLISLESDSLVVAGGLERIRVHIHVNNPAEVFLACESFGAIAQQKADDMQRQHGLLNHSGKVAIVTDSGADIPASEVERLGIHVVPVRLSFGDREYLDGVSLTPKEFYALLAQSDEAPLTSQPPAQDFSRIYSLLTSHGYEVISVSLSAQLSGTMAAALQAAERQETGQVRVIDSLSAATGQGLLAMAAAEAAARGSSPQEVERLLQQLIPQARVFAVAHDLSHAVKGGRVPPWVNRVTSWLHLNPVLTANAGGKLVLAGFHTGRGSDPVALGRSALRSMDADIMYRVLISHADNEQGAAEVRREILQQHARIHSCHVTEAGPAIGVHLGPGGLVVGLLPDMDPNR